MDADRYAFLMLNTRDGVLELNENRTRGWLYSVYLFWWLFANEDWLNSSHPLPMLRVVGAPAAVRSIIRSNLGEATVATFIQWELTSIREFSEALTIIVDADDRLMKSLEMQMELFSKGELLKIMEAQRQRWDEMKADIQQFSYVPLT